MLSSSSSHFCKASSSFGGRGYSLQSIVSGASGFCHEPRYWSATDRYRTTLLQRKRAQDAFLWFPYRFRAGRTTGNSRGHSLVQSPECGNESIKHGKIVSQLDDQVIILLRKSGTTFKGINQHTQESHASRCDITHAKWHHFCMN